MRVLKHHEQKLLKKVNFLAWKNEHNQRELQVRAAEGCAVPPVEAVAALLACLSTIPQCVGHSFCPDSTRPLLPPPSPSPPLPPTHR